MNSPYFNVNKKLIILSNILINVIKSKNAVTNKNEIWYEIEGNKNYNDLRFRKLCNDLVERFERFLIIEKLQKDSFLQMNLLLNTLKEKKILPLIDKQLSKTNNLYNRSIDNSSNFYLNYYNYEKFKTNLKIHFDGKVKIKNESFSETYYSLTKKLDYYYVIEKLRQAIDVVTWTKQYKSEVAIKIIHVINIIENEGLLDLPSVKVYYLILKMLTQEDSNPIYHDLKNIARKNINSFPKEEQSEIFDSLLSYCIRRVNKSESEFYHEYLEINEWGIADEFVLKQGKLSHISFRNYVVIGLRAGNFERVEKYIKSLFL